MGIPESHEASMLMEEIEELPETEVVQVSWSCFQANEETYLAPQGCQGPLLLLSGICMDPRGLPSASGISIGQAGLQFLFFVV